MMTDHPVRAAPDESFDIVAIGASHWLTCAAYLARAGLTVKVVERRAIVGGAAVTENSTRLQLGLFLRQLLHAATPISSSRVMATIVDRPSGYLCLLPGGLDFRSAAPPRPNA
jgi:hypothetical protein